MVQHTDINEATAFPMTGTSQGQPVVGTPLASLPQYGGAGGGQQAQNYYAGQEFAKLFGRNPTQAELDQFSGYYSGDPNMANLAAGNSAISAYYQAQSAPTPQDIFNRQQQQYKQNAPQFHDQVAQQFQSLLGRAPTQQELDHFGTLMASGQTDAYQLGQYLQQTPEYANAQDTQFRTQLGGQLNDINSQFFTKNIQPSIMGQFASQGRDVSGASTGLQYALANAAKEMQTQTSQYLAGVGASQYQGREAQATSDYQNMLSQNYGLQNAGVGNQMSMNNALFGNSLNFANTSQQQGQLMSYLRGMGRGSGTNWGSIGGLAGGGLGAGLGFMAGGPAGAMLGYGIGSGVGGTAGGLFGGGR